MRKATEIIALAQKSRLAAARRGRGTVMLCAYALFPSAPPHAWPSNGLLKLRARTIFLAVRWLENQKYSNETVALLAPEAQL